MSTEPRLSAIFGIWRLDGAPVDPGSMGRMSARLAHRGAEEWVGGGTSAGFGWRGRASSASNSIAESSAGILLIADARIDNRRELAAAQGGSD